MLEYELLDIEWELKYEFDQEPSAMLVKDDSDDHPTEQEERGKEKSTSQEVRCNFALGKT